MLFSTRRPVRPAAALAASLIAISCFVPFARADEPTIAGLLGRDLIGDNQALEDTQAFVESRIPRMPAVSTVEQWQEHAARIRRDVLENVVYRGEAAAWRDAPTKVEWLEEIDGGEGYKVKKLRYEALPGLWIPAVLYEPLDLNGPAPVAMNVNGHDGQGKAAPYKQIRCINQAKRGMLALNVEWLGMGQLGGEGYGHYRMNQLDLCGTSGLAPFYLAMKRGLDVLLSHEHADPDRVAVAGLSGGGWQTIVISSLDERVTLANPVAGYSSFLTRARHFSDLGDSEQTPNDLAKYADYTHLTALRAPRPTLLTYNSKDNCCFASGHALQPLMQASLPIFQQFEQGDRLRSHVNDDPGTHNFERENREALYRMIRDFFYDGSDSFPVEEIECSGEVKSAEQLHVELPESNASFSSLAASLAESLPRDRAFPEDRSAARAWRRDRSARLAQIVAARQYRLIAHLAGEGSSERLSASLWRLRIGDSWTVPAVELARPSSPTGKTAIVIADGGRQAAEEAVTRLLDEGWRVVAFDPFYFGESKIAQRDFLFALLVAATGERPLGIQASQIGAVADWLHSDRGLAPPRVVAIGPRTGLAALVAAALHRRTIDSVEVEGSYGSLKEVLEANLGVNQAPELFCFGLLGEFDIPQIAALAAPRPVRFLQASERVKSEMQQARPYFSLWEANLSF